MSRVDFGDYWANPKVLVFHPSLGTLFIWSIVEVFFPQQKLQIKEPPWKSREYLESFISPILQLTILAKIFSQFVAFLWNFDLTQSKQHLISTILAKNYGKMIALGRKMIYSSPLYQCCLGQVPNHKISKNVVLGKCKVTKPRKMMCWQVPGHKISKNVVLGECWVTNLQKSTLN